MTNLGKLAKPYEVLRLPVTVNAIEKLHRAKVTFPYNLNINNLQRFDIRSVVAVELAPNTEMIIGCSALVVPSKNSSLNNVVFYYNPLDINNRTDIKMVRPLKALQMLVPNTTGGDFYSIASERGTLFVYSFTNLLVTKPGIYDFNLG